MISKLRTALSLKAVYSGIHHSRKMSSRTAEDLKKVACQSIDKASKDLNKLSQDLWNNPELAFEERYAHQRLTDLLESYNFSVERNYILETAFKAKVTAGDGPNVALICEYDALPDIGHACGHNLIAEVGIGASIGVKAALDIAKEEGLNLGQLTTIGCPAEECGGGGKLDLIKGGAFSSTHVAMISHPYPRTLHMPLKFAMQIVTIRYLGKAAHAAGSPWEGINALDAAVTAYSSISCMRQQMKPTWRIHGVITDGGAKPNIIPEKAELEFYVRAPTMKEMKELMDKAEGCFRSAALATGCQVEISWHPKPYANVMTNGSIAEAYKNNAENIGVEFCKDKLKLAEASGSTDMGNVSHIVPSIHPMYYIGTDAANHTRDFNVASGNERAQKYTIDQAKALAMTAIDCYMSPKLMAAAREDFEQGLQYEGGS